MAENTTPTGFHRRELWVDARDLQSGEGEDALTPEEYQAALATRGREKLAEARTAQSFSVTVRTVNPTFELGRDFFLGDTITVTDERLGASASAVVTGAEYFWGREGQGLTLILGFSQPTIWEKLAGKAEK